MAADRCYGSRIDLPATTLHKKKIDWGNPFKEVLMKTASTLLLAAALAAGSTFAMAQEGLHTGKKSDQAPAAAESNKGQASSTPVGQGGTAGTHDTGSKPGPGRIGDVKTPGN